MMAVVRVRVSWWGGIDAMAREHGEVVSVLAVNVEVGGRIQWCGLIFVRMSCVGVVFRMIRLSFLCMLVLVVQEPIVWAVLMVGGVMIVSVGRVPSQTGVADRVWVFTIMVGIFLVPQLALVLTLIRIVLCSFLETIEVRRRVQTTDILVVLLVRVLSLVMMSCNNIFMPLCF